MSTRNPKRVRRVAPASRSAQRPSARKEQAAPEGASPSGTPSPDTILLAVTGMSPAVLTETIWALARENPPVIPSRVVVLTTSLGKAEIERQLFEPDSRLGGPSAWDALRASLERDGHDLSGRLRFGSTGQDVRVMVMNDSATGRSRELADIRTQQDNAAAADFLLEQVRAVVENPDTQLVASLAGGRKTMGALLYACMTLVGRETDRLTHVLVNDPFDTVRGFFFPGQPGELLTDREGRPHDPAAAQVELADVPFVPLRNLFRRELGRPAGGFLRMVEECREQVRRQSGQDVSLIVEQSRPAINVNGTDIRLAPREQVVLLFLASRVKRGEPVLSSYKDAEDRINEFQTLLRQSIPTGTMGDWRRGDALKSAFDEQDLRRAISSLRDKLRRTGGNAYRLAPCLPEKGRFSLEIPGPLIHIKE